MRPLPEKLGEKLCMWYDAGHRELPWRQDKEPYHVWLSEIMLQQTRVEAVKGYYARFLSELPTIEALCRLPTRPADEALGGAWLLQPRVEFAKGRERRSWSEHGGAFPGTYEAVRALPGVGDYTAGAICSICFELPTPAVDGNVLRVLSRVMEDGAPVTNQKTKAAYREALLPLYEAGSRGTLTQALMELGAMVCVPNGAPKCEICPLRGCVSCKRARHVGKIPRKRSKEGEAGGRENGFFYLTCDGCLAVRKRESKGLLAGLWELPNVEGKLDAAQALSFAEKAGCEPAELLKSVERVHVFTHITWRMRCYYIVCQAKSTGICLGGRGAAQRGCGAADGVPDVRRRGNIKASPYRGSVRGCFVSWETQPICGRGREACGQLLVGGDGIGHGAVVEGFIGVKVEIARAGETEEDRLSSPVSLHFSASSMAARMAWLDSGAGRMPFLLQSTRPPQIRLVCSTATASI